MTPHGGAGGGARAWRLVTATPGRPGHQPAGTMTGARGASLEVPYGLAENPLVRPVCHEAWPRLSLGMKYSHRQRAVVGRREASAQRSARAAPRLGAEVGYASVGVPLPCFLPFLHSWLEAQIVRVPASTAGILWRRSVRRAKRFVASFGASDDDSGADRIARTRALVIPGRAASASPESIVPVFIVLVSPEQTSAQLPFMQRAMASRCGAD